MKVLPKCFRMCGYLKVFRNNFMVFWVQDILRYNSNKPSWIFFTTLSKAKNPLIMWMWWKRYSTNIYHNMLTNSHTTVLHHWLFDWTWYVQRYWTCYRLTTMWLCVSLLRILSWITYWPLCFRTFYPISNHKKIW